MSIRLYEIGTTGRKRSRDIQKNYREKKQYRGRGDYGVVAVEKHLRRHPSDEIVKLAQINFILSVKCPLPSSLPFPMFSSKYAIVLDI